MFIICNICEKKFENKSLFANHYISHESLKGEAKKKKYAYMMLNDNWKNFCNTKIKINSFKPNYDDKNPKK
jgi:hypothetical protein